MNNVSLRFVMVAPGDSFELATGEEVWSIELDRETMRFRVVLALNLERWSEVAT